MNRRIGRGRGVHRGVATRSGNAAPTAPGSEGNSTPSRLARSASIAASRTDSSSDSTDCRGLRAVSRTIDRARFRHRPPPAVSRASRTI
ncbi:MAG: hypothetical protein ACK56I_00065, partial [bacterium]